MFGIGAVGVLVRRNVIVMLACLEVMLNASAMAFIVFSRMVGNETGHIFTLMIFVVAAVEVAIAIAMIVNIYRMKSTLTVDDFSLLRR
jgi:NADH-quinone oxidoreductase subunit K